jgi:hypothetical protein
MKASGKASGSDDDDENLQVIFGHGRTAVLFIII